MEKVIKSILILLFVILSTNSYSQGKAKIHNDKGLIKYENKDYKGALDDFNSAIFYNDNIADYYYNLGRTYFKLKMYLNAFYEFDEAIKEDNNVSMYYAYRGIARNRSNQKKKYLKYIEDYDRAIAIDSNNAVAYKYKGISYYYMKNYNKAIIFTTKAISIDSLDPEMFYYRGISRINFNDNDGCNDIFKADELGLKMKKNRIAQNCYTSKLKIKPKQTDNNLLITKIDSIEDFKLFYDKNTLTIERLAKTFRELPLDRCLTKEIEIAIAIDTLGKLTSAKIFKGKSNPYLDSLVINDIMSFNETWHPYKKKNISINFNVYIKFDVKTVHTSAYSSKVKSERVIKASIKKNLYCIILELSL